MRGGAEIWACCLLPRHVRLIVAPKDEDLQATFAELRRRYSGVINARFRWTGKRKGVRAVIAAGALISSMPSARLTRISAFGSRTSNRPSVCSKDDDSR
jgi:REP element-mobilizing transposase RayT